MEGNFWGLSLGVTVAFLIHIVWIGKRVGWLTLDTVFGFSLWILSFGTLKILDYSNPVDQTYASVIAVPTFIYYVSSILTNAFLSARTRVQRSPIRFEFLNPGVLGYGLLAISVLVTILYYISVGYNVFLAGLSDNLSGSSTQDYSSMRLESYSAESGYLFPGYVNQFKNSILPAMVITVILYLFHKKRKSRWLLTIALIGFALIAVLGTGQRSMMVLVSYMLLVFTYQLNPSRFLKRSIGIAALAIPLLLFSTFLLGRNQQEVDQASSIWGKASVLLDEFTDRLFYVQQWSGQMVFHYTETQPTQWGAEWWKGITGILPGVEGTDLPNIVFNILYGTDRGTATPSIWGSVFYNFSWWGVIIVPIALALISQNISYRFANSNEFSVMELVSYSGFTAVAGNWIAGGPEYLLNAGAVTFAILWLLASRQRKNGKQAPSRFLGDGLSQGKGELQQRVTRANEA